MENVTFPTVTFDLVISSLAVPYVKNFESLVTNIAKLLKPKGEFVFSVEHPIFTSQGTQEWYYDEKNESLHCPIDNYYYEGKRKATFFRRKGNEISSYTNHLFESLVTKWF